MLNGIGSNQLVAAGNDNIWHSPNRGKTWKIMRSIKTPKKSNKTSKRGAKARGTVRASKAT